MPKSLRTLWLAPCLVALALAAPAAELEVEGESHLRFDADVLANLGLELAQPRPSAPALREGGLGFRVAKGSSLAFEAPGGDFEGFDALALRHAGGFALRAGGRRFSLDGVRTRAAATPYELVFSDARGRELLFTRSMHALLDPAAGALRLRNADLLLGPELAAQLGRPELAGSYVGVFDADYHFTAAAPGALAQGGACTPNLGPPVDVLLTDLDQITQMAREAGGRVAMAPRAELRNDGPGDVEWGYAISPDEQPSGTLGPHPYLALAFYRLDGDVLEQIGRADVKHAFFAVNTGCACAGGNVLFAGCSDVYGAFTNDDPLYLGPRDEVDAFPRDWASLGSHFDGGGTPDVRDHHGDADHDDYEHRLVVQEPDLQTPGARYFIEAWYLSPGDSNLANSVGHREVDPSLGGSTWSFPIIDGGLANGSILDELVAPGSPPPGSDNRWLDTTEGRLQLTVDSRDLLFGDTEYVYTLMNFDYDRGVRSFRVPLEPGHAATLTAVAFSDSDSDAGNDWTASVDAQGITWTAPPGNELDWGGLYGFRFEVDAEPVSTLAQLAVAEPGAPYSLAIRSLGPAAPPVPALGRGLWPLGAAASLCAIAWLWLRRRALPT